MSDELTQLEVARKVLADFMFEAFRSSDQGAKKIKEAHKALDLLLAPREAGTKPLVTECYCLMFDGPPIDPKTGHRPPCKFQTPGEADKSTIPDSTKKEGEK